MSIPGGVKRVLEKSVMRECVVIEQQQVNEGEGFQHLNGLIDCYDLHVTAHSRCDASSLP